MKILVVADHYLPGYKAGGPIKTIANLVEMLGDKFDFMIITRDRDLGDSIGYAGVSPRIWHKVGKAAVMYLSPCDVSIYAWRRLLKQLDYDLLYLNGFFSRMTIRTLLLRRLGLIAKKPIVLAPRGEFSRGALAIKPLKKRLFIAVSQLVGLYKGIRWQASNKYEAADISKGYEIIQKNIYRADVPIITIASDPIITYESVGARPVKEQGTVRMAFLSRIVIKKNLLFALKLLEDLPGHIQFDIYGPRENVAYWKKCERVMKRLPQTIQVAYRGVVRADSVIGTLSHYHLFLFPTRGENFGHVIFEAIFSGCLVVISDQTTWRDLEIRGFGWDIPLNREELFKDAIKKVINMDNKEFVQRSNLARAFAIELLVNQKRELGKAYQKLFELT